MRWLRCRCGSPMMNDPRKQLYIYILSHVPEKNCPMASEPQEAARATFSRDRPEAWDSREMATRVFAKEPPGVICEERENTPGRNSHRSLENPDEIFSRLSDFEPLELTSHLGATVGLCQGIQNRGSIIDTFENPAPRKKVSSDRCHMRLRPDTFSS